MLENLIINEDENDPDVKYIEKHEMPNLLGRSVNEVKEELEGYGLDIVEIFDGSKIIGQLPKEMEDVYTYQKVFLLTDGSSMTVPDFKGWTRKDVIDFWNLSRIPMKMEGYGVAYEQSVEPGSIADPDKEIIIRFREINYPEEQEKKAEQENTEVSETNEGNGV